MGNSHSKNRQKEVNDILKPAVENLLKALEDYAVNAELSDKELAVVKQWAEVRQLVDDLIAEFDLHKCSHTAAAKDLETLKSSLDMAHTVWTMNEGLTLSLQQKLVIAQIAGEATARIKATERKLEDDSKTGWDKFVAVWRQVLELFIVPAEDAAIKTVAAVL